jgi:membrane protease subunit HflC
MGAKTLSIIIVLIFGFFILSSSLFVVDVREHAIQLRTGKIARADFEPGLYFKIPFVDVVRKFDKRILTFDANPEEFTTINKKYLEVDYFVKFRIVDPLTFYTSVGGDVGVVSQRMSRIINDGLRSEFGKRTIQEVVSGERNEIMDIMQKKANEDTALFGVNIVDVRIKRIDLTPKVRDSVYERMRAERTRIAKEYRSEGEEEAEKIRADADRQRTVLLANAYKQAQTIRGEGDAKAARIYARAYNRDPEFYSFYRSLNAYRQTFGKGNDVLVLQPDSEFFKYFMQQRSR